MAPSFYMYMIQSYSICMYMYMAYANATQRSTDSCVLYTCINVESVAQVHINFIAITFCIRLESSHPALAAIFQRRQKQRDGWLPANVKPRWVGVACVSHVSTLQFKKVIPLCTEFDFWRRKNLIKFCNLLQNRKLSFWLILFLMFIGK